MTERTDDGRDVGLSVEASPGFAQWLAGVRVAFVVSTYQAGMLLLISADAATGRLRVLNRHLARPMGLACDGRRLAVAAQTQIVTFVDARWGAEGDGDPVFVPQVAHFTSDLDVHDLAFAGGGGAVFVNTRFSCIATVSESHSFRPLWRPRFVSALAPEDRCHLNGFALRDGVPAFATALAATDAPEGWRAQRATGGVLIDIASDEIVAAGLSMPHSPRWRDGRLWLLRTGTGEIGVVDPASGRFEAAAFCPGYLRGLCFVGGFAVVAASRPRAGGGFDDLPVGERLSGDGAPPVCGLFVVDTASGAVAHRLSLGGAVTELFDVAPTPSAGRPALIGFRSREIERVISIEC